jgi:hypothetical protein
MLTLLPPASLVMIFQIKIRSHICVEAVMLVSVFVFFRRIYFSLWTNCLWKMVRKGSRKTKGKFHGNRHVNDAKKPCVDNIEQPCVSGVSVANLSASARKIGQSCSFDATSSSSKDDEQPKITGYRFIDEEVNFSSKCHASYVENPVSVLKMIIEKEKVVLLIFRRVVINVVGFIPPFLHHRKSNIFLM